MCGLRMAKPILIVDEEDIYFPTLFFPLGPIHTAATASSTMSIFDADNGFYGNKWVCSHGHLCQRLLLQHGEVIFLMLSLTHRVNGSLPFSQTLGGKDDIHIATLRIHDKLLSKFCECMTYLSD